MESTPAEPALGPADRDAGAPLRAVRHEYTRNWVPILSHLGASLLVSTYQAGKLVVVGVRRGALGLSYHNFERAMGLAARTDRLAVGTHQQVWFLQAAPEIA